MRQDAIMTQVFRYVNGLMMRRDHSSRPGSRSAQQGLQMVTYNVSPLSPMSGVSIHCSDFSSMLCLIQNILVVRRYWSGSKIPFRLEVMKRIPEHQGAPKDLALIPGCIQASGEIPCVGFILVNHLRRRKGEALMRFARGTRLFSVSFSLRDLATTCKLGTRPR